MATQGLARSLQKGISNHDDPATVKAGAPAYMLILDGFIQDNPGDQKLLLAAARLYGIYATIFVDDPSRAKLLSRKARSYARRAICLSRDELCNKGRQSFDEFVAIINTIGKSDIDTLFTYATTWAGWVKANRDDWNAIADVPRIEVIMQRVVSLDDGYQRGQAHLYLGILQTRLPASLGGKPEQGRKHFERATELSSGRNLIAKVEFARRYARLLFRRGLHDRLLNEVLKASPVEPGLTLSNTLARQQAQQLLKSADDYFQGYQ